MTTDLLVAFAAGVIVGGALDRLLFPVVFAVWRRLIRRDDGR
jgi:hypothetical protein